MKAVPSSVRPRRTGASSSAMSSSSSSALAAPGMWPPPVAPRCRPLASLPPPPRGPRSAGAGSTFICPGCHIPKVITSGRDPEWPGEDGTSKRAPGREVRGRIQRDELRRRGAHLRGAVSDGVVPGLVLLAAAGGETVFHRAFGHRQLIPDPRPAFADTLYDVASLTKAVVTTRAGHDRGGRWPAQVATIPSFRCSPSSRGTASPSGRQSRCVTCSVMPAGCRHTGHSGAKPGRAPLPGGASRPWPRASRSSGRPGRGRFTPISASSCSAGCSNGQRASASIGCADDADRSTAAPPLDDVPAGRRRGFANARFGRPLRRGHAGLPRAGAGAGRRSGRSERLGDGWRGGARRPVQHGGRSVGHRRRPVRRLARRRWARWARRSRRRAAVLDALGRPGIDLAARVGRSGPGRVRRPGRASPARPSVTSASRAARSGLIPCGRPGSCCSPTASTRTSPPTTASAASGPRCTTPSSTPSRIPPERPAGRREARVSAGRPAAAATACRVRDPELVRGAGHRHVQQAAGVVARRVGRVGDLEEDHDVELQALRLAHVGDVDAGRERRSPGRRPGAATAPRRATSAS